MQVTEATAEVSVASVTKRGESKHFIRHLHAFRGFAILTIVAAHAWGGQVWRMRHTEPSFGVSMLEALSEMPFHDTSPYFALISVYCSPYIVVRIE